MYSDRIEGYWRPFAGNIKKKWSQLSAAVATPIVAARYRFSNTLHGRHFYTKGQAHEALLDEFMNRLKQ
jgi:hypothetical protein